jgi:hypothetical protein
VTPFDHLSEDSQINCPLRARPITASGKPFGKVIGDPARIGAIWGVHQGKNSPSKGEMGRVTHSRAKGGRTSC